jgi:hypothetical protein
MIFRRKVACLRRLVCFFLESGTLRGLRVVFRGSCRGLAEGIVIIPSWG